MTGEIFATINPKAFRGQPRRLARIMTELAYMPGAVIEHVTPSGQMVYTIPRPEETPQEASRTDVR